jgi:hypothetical protein
MKRLLPTLLLTLTLATPALAADKTGVREVCAKSTYVKRSPGFVVLGTLFKDQRIKVTRYDKSGEHAYGYAYGHVRKHGWVLARDLCK